MRRMSGDDARTPAGTHDLPGAQVFNSPAPHPEGYFWQGEGPLSVKWFPKGQATYEADGGRFLVGAREFLILNDGQPYSVTRPPEAEAESFLIFFERAFASEALRSLSTPEDRLLDTPAGVGDGPPEFFTRVYPFDETVASRVLRLRAALAGGPQERLRLEEQLCGVLESLLLTHRITRREVERVAAARRATRGELYRRLHRARDYAAATLGQPLTLGEMARVACLSPNHFLRSFKQLFSQTPHQYLTGLRLARAEELLAATDLPVTEICFAVGFESLGSFSTLFRRRVGVSPQAYRRGKKVIFEK
jgi:AraC family transcriptional regulator